MVMLDTTWALYKGKRLGDNCPTLLKNLSEPMYSELDTSRGGIFGLDLISRVEENRLQAWEKFVK